MSVNKYSTTADSNLIVGDGDGAVSIAEGMPRGEVNNAMRAIAADLAKEYKDTGGISSAGTGDALTITTNADFDALSEGIHITFKAHTDILSGATVNVNGIGPRAIKVSSGNALVGVVAGVFPSGSLVSIFYDGVDWVVGNIGAAFPSFEYLEITGSGDARPGLSITSGEEYFNGTSIVPRVPALGLVDFEDGQLRMWPDLSGDGDYDADMWAQGNLYLAAQARIHLRTNIPDENGSPGDNEGRLVIGAIAGNALTGSDPLVGTNMIQSSQNFVGTDQMNFSIGPPNSTNFWSFWDADRNGQLGLGHKKPVARLHTKDTSELQAIFESSSADAEIALQGSSTENNQQVRIKAVGNNLDLKGGETGVVRLNAFGMFPTTDNDLISGSGSFAWQVVNSYSYNTVSDARFKENLGEIDTDQAINLVRMMNPTHYTHNGTGGVVRSGFIAQEVKEAMDTLGINCGLWSMADADDPESRQSLRMDDIMSILFAAVKGMDDRIRKLEEGGS